MIVYLHYYTTVVNIRNVQLLYNNINMDFMCLKQGPCVLRNKLPVEKYQTTLCLTCPK